MKKFGLALGGGMAAIAAFVVVSMVGGGIGSASAEFVCPVTPINQAAVDNAADGTFTPIGEGDYSNLATIINDTVASDPANNRVTKGTPGGSHADPGDSDYTAIWDDGEPSGATKNPQD